MEEQKKARRGRPVTAYKVPLMVRISQEAADKIAGVANKSEYIDTLIKNSLTPDPSPVGEGSR